jgi:hypothetical protein
MKAYRDDLVQEKDEEFNNYLNEMEEFKEWDDL